MTRPQPLGRIPVPILLIVFIITACFPVVRGQAAPSTGLAEIRPTLVFILDGSGSMWGRIQGRPKIVIAKKVLSDMIAEIGEDTDIGLVSYGHRREADCGDVEVLVPPGRADRELFLKRLAGLNPRGKTPISRAVRETVELVRESAGPVTLVLVSDGKETCGGDPCWLVEHLRKTVFDFKMQVIGFDVSPDETEQLECIAGAGEGKYYSARNAVELEIAVRQLTEETLLPQGPALAVGAVKNGREIKSQITILTRGEKDPEVVRFADTERFNPQLFYLEPGRYEVRVTEGDGGRGRTLSRKVDYQGRNQAVVVVFEEGLLRLKAVKNELPALAEITVQDLETNTRAAGGTTEIQNPVEIALPPGRYELRVRDLENRNREVVVIPEVVMENNAEVEQVVDFPEGTILVRILVNGRPAEGGLDVFLSGTREWVRSADSSGQGSISVPLLPGEYDLKVVAPELKGQPPLEFGRVKVEPGRETAIRAELQEAKLSIRVLINGRPGQGRIEVAGSRTGRVVFKGDTGSENPISLRLVPGIYDVKAIDSNVSAYPFFPSRLVEGLEIRAGAREELVFRFQEGGLGLILENQADVAGGVFYIYSSGSGEEIECGPMAPGREVSLTLEPGLYDVVVETLKNREQVILRREEVEVLPGFKTILDFQTTSPDS